MKLKMYAVYDRQLEAFGNPGMYTAHGAAAREFADEVNRKESNLGKHPEDYALYYLGEYDNSNATFEATTPQLKSQAKDQVRE